MADKYSWSNATNYDVGNADGVKGNVTQWSRSTVADGKWLNQETILPMSGRDQYLLDSLNDVDDDVESCVDRIELLETSATDHENRLQQMQLEIDGKQDLLTSNNAGFGIQINQEESEGVPSHPVIAVYAHNTDNITVHSQQGSTSVGFALNEDISVNSITALENGEGKKITGFNAVYTESIGLQDESDSITTEEIINGLTNTVSLQGSKSISISEPDSSNVSNVSVITHKTGTTEDGGLSVDDSGLKVNVDNSSIQITSNAIEAKLSSTGAIEKTASNGGLGVKVDNSSIQISSNTIKAKLKANAGLEETSNNGGLGVKVNTSSMELDTNGVGVKLYSEGGLKTGEYGVQVKLHTDADTKTDDSGLGVDERGLKVNVDNDTIKITEGKLTATTIPEATSGCAVVDNKIISSLYGEKFTLQSWPSSQGTIPASDKLYDGLFIDNNKKLRLDALPMPVAESNTSVYKTKVSNATEGTIYASLIYPANCWPDQTSLGLLESRNEYDINSSCTQYCKNAPDPTVNEIAGSTIKASTLFMKHTLCTGQPRSSNAADSNRYDYQIDTVMNISISCIIPHNAKVVTLSNGTYAYYLGNLKYSLGLYKNDTYTSSDYTTAPDNTLRFSAMKREYWNGRSPETTEEKAEWQREEAERISYYNTKRDFNENTIVFTSSGSCVAIKGENNIPCSIIVTGGSLAANTQHPAADSGGGLFLCINNTSSDDMTIYGNIQIQLLTHAVTRKTFVNGLPLNIKTQS